MKNLLLILLFIAIIEWNLGWNGIENIPNQVRAWDTDGQEVQTIDNWQKIDNVYYWNVYFDGKLLTFLNFWTTY